MNDTQNDVMLDIIGLKKYFPIKRGVFRRTVGHLKAVDDIHLTVKTGETFGLVGESGCGKTTTGLMILRGIEPTAGQTIFHLNGQTYDINQMDAKTLKAFRKNIQMIFQDPYSSLNPRMTTLETIGEPLLVNNIARGKALEGRVRELMDMVGLNKKYLRRYPHAFSGGQRQRIGIARALALNPKCIVADEPVSALDVSIQAQILNLLKELREKLNLTYIFISHDLSVVKFICTRVAVMYVGKIVELAETSQLFNSPLHPYTEALLSAVPKLDPLITRHRQILEGDIADPANSPTGCYFHPRCRYAKEICKAQMPDLRELESGHQVRCHRAEELSLRGIG